MIDWIFEGIANWVASIMTQVMDAVSGVFLEALGTDMTAMEEYFPFVTAAYSIMQYTAWALLFLIVVWQLFRTFGGPITEAEPPFELLARGALFAFLITYAKPIFSLVLEIARAPYTALMESSLDPGDFTFAGIEQALTSGLTTIVSVATVVGLILLIVMMIALGWNYFKLLLETVERYVLVGGKSDGRNANEPKTSQNAIVTEATEITDNDKTAENEANPDEKINGGEQTRE